MASLDTPAKGIPTWALLFSQLPAPATSTAAGSGYHVAITGYGNNGTGQGGAAGSDFRRRLAENMIGGLASLGDFEQFLFGPTGTTDATNPQNLYWMDFDDPRRGTASASPYDFNAWRDNALPNEGITSQGDSGGPMILDRAYARQLVIGVLSGGYTRFFTGQPANGYGTAGFYQPLYLYWDWIAANNPYHYVTNVAGNGNWNDPTRWVTTLDPNYMILSGGNAVNGIPTDLGTGNSNTPGWGQACYQTTTSSECRNIATGVDTVTATPIGQAEDSPASASVSPGDVTDNKDTVTIAAIEGQAAQVLSKDNAQLESQAGGVTALALPLATLANGLPGATNFVPNNNDGNRLTNTAPRYFDVTLSAAGTTTLNTVATVDRFTLAGGTAVLDIAAGGSLTSLMDITQATGTMQVNGSITTPGDYLMLSGGLNGTGTVSSAFFTNIAGTIAPATVGTVGTLTFRGNVILASGGTYMVDLSGTGASDLIRVQATTFTGTTPTNGVANIGGRLTIGFTDALRAGQTYTILTAEGGLTGTFQTPTSFSAILRPTVTYTA
ncbi:MAG: trypsin-like serine protease, partial [Oxalobacteraceae bacterium]